jgi:integrase
VVETWDEVEALARELGLFGPLAIFCVGTGARPEEAFGGDWTDVDVDAGTRTVRCAFAQGRLKTYAKTAQSRRRVPLRAKVVAVVETLPRRRGILFPAASRADQHRQLALARVAPGAQGGRLGAPANLRHAPHVRDAEPRGRHEHLHSRAADGHERPGDRRHVRTLAHDVDDHDRELLDAGDDGSGHAVGTDSLDDDSDGGPNNDEDPAFAGPSK